MKPENVKEFFIDCPKNDIRELMCQLLMRAFKNVYYCSKNNPNLILIDVTRCLFESVYTAAFAT